MQSVAYTYIRIKQEKWYIENWTGVNKKQMKYIIAGKEFATVKEAVNYQNEIQLQNRDNMFDKSKQIDATIRGVENK